MVAKYLYDAWGNCTISSETTNTVVANANPIRYRGYYYDDDTGFYYLQSRYYDPAIGRFINADSLVSTGQGVLGNNMFAYCLNSPVSLTDAAGSAAKTCLTADGAIDDTPWWDHSPGGGGIPPRNNINSLQNTNDNLLLLMLIRYIFNSDETAVLNAKHFAFYKGALVLKADLMEGGGAFSYFIIVMDDEYIADSDGIEVLNHEYGHLLHLQEIGPLKYTLTVAIPSLIGASLSEIGMLNVDYYSLPWEYIANTYGGVSWDEYTSWADGAGSLYWLFTVMLAG